MGDKEEGEDEENETEEDAYIESEEESEGSRGLMKMAEDFGISKKEGKMEEERREESKREGQHNSKQVSVKTL